MTDQEKATFATTVFESMLTEKLDRLKHGAILRQTMFDTIQRGETPKGYRADWLRKQAAHLNSALGEIARKFDAEHPDDKCSVQDLLDILATTTDLYRTKVL
jgi:hypothetical protein